MKSNNLYLKAATETVNLIGKLLSYLIETNRTGKFDDFLTQIHTKANRQVNETTEQDSKAKEKDGNMKYWEGVRDVVNLAKSQWSNLQDINMFNLFLINCVPSLTTDVTLEKRIEDLDGLEELAFKEVTFPSDPTYTETAIRTLNLIRRTLKHFAENQELDQFSDFINQMKTRAETKFISIEDKSINEIFDTPNDRENTKYYWQAIYDIVKIASNQWESIQDPQQLYAFTKGIEVSIIRQERIYINKQGKYEFSEELSEIQDYYFPKTISSSIKEIKETPKQVMDSSISAPSNELEIDYLDDSLRELSRILSDSTTLDQVPSPQDDPLIKDIQTLPDQETQPVLDKAKILKEVLVECGFEEPYPDVKNGIASSDNLTDKLLSHIENDLASKKTKEDNELSLALKKTLRMLKNEF
ncbi:MAG: hypothetical protein ACFE9L_02215 [Candidatus Hodarchaeota archaeon]